MTSDYILKKAVVKFRLTEDLRAYTSKKIIAGYIYYISVFLLGLTIAIFLSKWNMFQFEDNLPVVILFGVLPLLMIWRIVDNYKNSKYKFKHFNSRVEQLDNNSISTLEFVKSVNGLYRSRQKIHRSFLRDQKNDPILAIILITASFIKGYSELDGSQFYVILIFYVAFLSISIGFLIGIRKTLERFEEEQASISYSIRNGIVNHLLTSQLKPQR